MAAQLSVNQNTVLKAYRELDYDGLVTRQPGVGTFVRVTMADAALAEGPMSQELDRWLATARTAGLDDESIEALFATRLRARGIHPDPTLAGTGDPAPRSPSPDPKPAP